MSKKPPPDELQTIDPTALAGVSGGAGADAAVTQALTSVIDSLKSLQSNKQSGFDPTTMMMMMMMMGGRNNSAPVAVAPANTIGGYAGYTIDGVYYPFK